MRFWWGDKIGASITFDEATADSRPDSDSLNRFTDPTGSISLTNLRTGHTIVMLPGVHIDVEQTGNATNPGSGIVKFQTPRAATASAPFFRLAGPIVLEFPVVEVPDGPNAAFLTDATSLSVTAAQLQALLSDGLFAPGVLSTGTNVNGRVDAFGPGSTGNINFGAPHSATQSFSGLTPIPLPAAGWALLAAVGGLAALRRRKPAV